MQYGCHAVRKKLKSNNNPEEIRNAPWWPPSWISIWPPYFTYFCL